LLGAGLLLENLSVAEGASHVMLQRSKMINFAF
jgi:hypothetical protein